LRRGVSLVSTAFKAKMGAKTLRILDVETIARKKGKARDLRQWQFSRHSSLRSQSEDRAAHMPIFLQDGVERTMEACAGKLDGETPERRIMKEMQEDLGYKISNLQRLF
jgi:hypothetical protein